MAAEIKITGRKVIKTINKEFQEKFPYLILYILTTEEWEAARNKEDYAPVYVPGNVRLSDVRTKTPKTSKQFSIHGRTKVGNLEDNFVNEFGLHTQIGGGDKEGNFFYSNKVGDEYSLTQLNKLFEKGGKMKKKARPDDYK